MLSAAAKSGSGIAIASGNENNIGTGIGVFSGSDVNVANISNVQRYCYNNSASNNQTTFNSACDRLEIANCQFNSANFGKS